MKSESPRSAESQPLSSTPTTTYVVASSSGGSAPHRFTLLIVAALYVLSGSTQPLLITLVKSAGLGDPHCQVYMLMYYLGPAMVSFTLCLPTPASNSSSTRVTPQQTSPSFKSLVKASSIALIDIVAQATNYTGASMAGPTLFAIIYSSVTVWAAVYSRIFLKRKLSWMQWVGIFVVFGGLTITATSSIDVGEDVFFGAMLVLAGSSMHAMTYVLSEAIMGSESSKTGNSMEQNKEMDTLQQQQHGECTELTVQQNCAMQGIVATAAYLVWQFIYTKPHYQERIAIPMQDAGTSPHYAILLLLSLSASNLMHALTFFYTLKYFPGGATSAGVMKGLQAVLVFIFTSLVYCGSSLGGDEMCFTTLKFASLVVVCGGVIMFALASDGVRLLDSSKKQENNGYVTIGNTTKDSGIESSFSVV
mmetsp:Transcript_26853/g.39778  ORF Transcript_26853/g.39778 Transcript_26853/m.39778 type:complete len:419 (+) Transcript_26853:182-1438(+)|eukprot:CAMPEP_0194088998 /NCGR_PEP_ID=MMETSP0149-20130528/32124_1 /TAXON_ID=122233 /ORGANISM="Chaetoceros debilis, Strain MM31A-1" /LENGTH=418 /DNA_ID=CAMNT_0038772783 /DNA_START=125 /DNA_END=1381 /DNA_ORIENTATION=+